MTLFTDAYIMAVLPRSTRPALSPGGQQLAVIVTQDGLDLSLGALVYKAINAVEGLVDKLGAWHERRVAIHRLRALDDHMLKDIGLHRVLKDVGLHRGDGLAMADGLITLEDIVHRQNRHVNATSVASTKPTIRGPHAAAANDNELASAA